MSVTIIGTVAFDSVSTPKGSFDRILGGSATYAGTAASIFGPTHLVSVIGADFEEAHLQFFQDRGMSIEGIERRAGQTFHWKGFYGADMSQAFTVSTELNVLLEFNPIIPKIAQDSRVVFLANSDPVLQRQAISQFSKPELIMLDSMNFWIENHLHNLKETLAQVDLLILNDQEIRLLTKQDNLILGMKAVLAMGPKRVIVKKGEHGSAMLSAQGYFSIPAFPLEEVVDPTGAGDSFAGAIAGYLAQSVTLDEDAYKRALMVGTLVASQTVQDFSLNHLKKLSKSDIEGLFNQFLDCVKVPVGF